MSATSIHALNAYRQIDVQSGVDAASPHSLIGMLMAGVLAAVAAARGHMQHNEVAAKGINISKAIDRVEGLRANLDIEAGGEIARNLGRLYEYISIQLIRANLTNDPALLDEVATLMNSIKSAWDAIATHLESPHR